jgi:hypothetical protein
MPSFNEQEVIRRVVTCARCQQQARYTGLTWATGISSISANAPVSRFPASTPIRRARRNLLRHATSPHGRDPAFAPNSIRGSARPIVPRALALPGGQYCSIRQRFRRDPKRRRPSSDLVR